MSSFTTPLITEDLGGRQFRVCVAFVYDVGNLGSGRKIYVPENFVTDFASIPRGLWNAFPPVGASYDKAAVVHDYLYRGGFITWRTMDQEKIVDVHEPVTRKQADDILLEAMTALKVGRFTRWCVYSAVRVGGAHAWASDHAQVKG